MGAPTAGAVAWLLAAHEPAVRLLTRRDLRFLPSTDVPVSEVMTRDKLVTAKEDTTLEQAQRLLMENKVEKLLLVDEPAAGMTDAETHQTAELLKEINKERSVVVVEHDMVFVRELGVRVTCLHEGSVLAEGSLDQVAADDRVIEVYLGR